MVSLVGLGFWLIKFENFHHWDLKFFDGHSMKIRARWGLVGCFVTIMVLSLGLCLRQG